MSPKINNNKKKKGFTMIELLVAILIIGILAAIALPQYRRAMIKTESTQMLTNLQAFHQAQQNFYFFSEKYAETFASLEVGFKDFSRDKCSEDFIHSYGHSDMICNDKYALIMSTTFGTASLTVFLNGPYRMSGFRFQEDDDPRGGTRELLCYDYTNQGFCRDIWHCSFYKSLNSSVYFYRNCKL